MNITQQMNASSLLGKKDYSGAITQGISGMMQSLPFGTSTARTDREAAIQSAQSVLSGASTGMKVGGPIGAAIGAGIGAIGKSGSYTSPTSFTDYGDYTLGTGLQGLFNNSALKRKVANMKRSIDANKVSIGTTAGLLADWEGEQSDLATYKNGGMTNNNYQYLDDGEVFKTPDQQVYQIPEMGNGTDQNKMQLPNGTKILSDTLKVPGTNKTFAELGKELMNSKTIKGSDKFAENTKKLTEMNNSKIHDELFSMQESMKNTNNTFKNKFVTGGQIMSGLGAAANIFGQLAPVLSQAGAKPELVESIYNPYENAALAAMKRRRYNIDPILQQLNLNRAVGNYASSTLSPSTGAGMVQRQLSATGLNKQYADIYNQAQNINNQYLADYANTLSQFGAQRAQADTMTRDINMRSKAAAQAARQAAMGQFSKYAQTQELMRNQKAREAQMMPLYTKMLESAYGKDFASTISASLMGTPLQASQSVTGIPGVTPRLSNLDMPKLNIGSSFNTSGFPILGMPGVTPNLSPLQMPGLNLQTGINYSNLPKIGI